MPRIIRWLPIGLIGGVAVFTWLALTGRPHNAVAAAAAPAAPNSVDARAVYLRDCAMCHGADARGTVFAPSLQGVGRAAVDYYVTTGRMPLLAPGDARPARSPENTAPPGQYRPDASVKPERRPPLYSPATITALEDYVASIAPGGPDIPQVDLSKADVAQGGELFRQQCAACHEWAGVGGALYQREAPTLHPSTPTQIADAVRVGPGQMPKFGESAVPQDRLNDLIGYVRYLDHPQNRGGGPLWYLGPVAEGAVAIIGALGALLLAVRWIGQRG